MTNPKATKIQAILGFLALFVLAGCATNFAPKPLPPNHPASVQAQEAPRTGIQRLIGTDAITRKTIAQLERKDAPNPDYQSGGMSHDMGNMGGMDQSQMKGMEGMDHSKMPGMDMSKPPAGAPAPSPAGMDHSKMSGMDMNKPPAGAATPPGGMDHSKMPGMTMPTPGAAASPASKEGAEMEMKKTSDEMKKLSDEMKAKSDAEKSSEKPQTEVGYWTCVMHPEIHETKPGQCPKCGMTLVKKEGALK